MVLEQNHHARPDDASDAVEYCPVSIGTKILGDRWTLLIVRELLSGTTRFSDLYRGLPGLSRSMLAGRLKRLEHHGLIERADPDAPAAGYRLTDAGAAMRPVLLAIGEWTVRWRFPDPTDARSDASLLLLRLKQGVLPDRLPDRRVTVEITFTDAERPHRRGWLLLDRPDRAICVEPPRHDTDLAVTTTTETWRAWWYGHRTYTDIVRSGDLTVTGDRRLARSFPTWFRRSPFAPMIARALD